MNRLLATGLATGLLASFITGSATADLLWTTSFEDTNDLGAKYYDYVGGSAVDHWLINNEGQAAVNGDGFSAWYGTTGGVGLEDGDYVGVTTYMPGGNSSYDGNQHYQISDTDGIFELHFDGYEGSASTVSLAIFVQDTGYESSDFLSIHWGADPDNGTLFDISEDGLEEAGEAGQWMFLEFDVSALGEGHLHVRVENNSGSEAIFVDAVSIFGGVIPAPGAFALLGLAGIASRRRRR